MPIHFIVMRDQRRPSGGGTPRRNLMKAMLFMVAVACLVLTSCSIEKHMEKKTNELVKQMEALPQWETLPEEVVPWSTAVNMAMKQNIDLRRAQVAIEEAERSVRQIFLDMIPGVNLDAMITEDVKSFSGLSANNIEYHTNILFNFPSLTKVPVQYYTAKASVFKSKKSMDLKKREIISRLYKIAQEYELASRFYLFQKKNLVYGDDGRELKRIEEEWQLQSKKLSSELSIAIGNVDKRWVIDARTLPVLHWEQYRKASGQLDFLVLTMMAMEIESSRLNMLGIRMRYYPELDVNFYSPSLFTSTGGTQSGVYADSGDMRLNMNLSWKLDTQLRTWSQLKSAKASHQFLVEEIRMRMIDRREKIKQLLKSREDFEDWHRIRNSRVDFMMSRTPLSVEDYKKTIEEMNDLTKEMFNQATRNAEVEAALIIEYGLL